jgi:energy-coupling factor transport system permease protein
LIDLTYRQLDSPIHGLGILPKAILFGLLGLLALLYSDILFLFMLIAACLCLSYLGGVSRSIVGLLRFFTVFALVVFVVNLVANQHGENPLLTSTFRFYFWRITFRITLESISAATRMVLRLLALILSFLLFTLTTKPENLMARFSAIRGMEGFGLLLGLAYKFMPVIVADGIDIRDSLRTRGVRFDDGGRMERARSYASLGVPLLINSLDRSLQLSEALEARGYGSGRRWSVPPLTRNRYDALVSIYGLILGGILLYTWIIWEVGNANLVFLPSNFVFLPIIFVALLLPIAWRWMRDRN